MRTFAKKLTDTIEGFSMIFLILMLLIVGLQVITRLTIKTSPRWCEEVASILMTWFAFLGMSIGVGEGIHMAIEFFINRFPKGLRKTITMIGELLVIYYGGSLLWFGGKLVYFTRTSTLPATQWPAFMPYIMAPIAGFSIIIFTLVKLMALLKDEEIDKTGEMGV